MAGLTHKQQAFVDEYLIDLNATQAAIRAGYSKKTANEQGARLLANVSVGAAVQKAMDKRSKKTEITAEYVLTTIVNTIERCQQLEQVMERRDGELVPTGEYKFDSTAVLKGAELLGKHLKLFTDKVEHTGKIEVESLTDDDIDRQISETLARLGVAAGEATPSQATAGKVKKDKNT